MKKTIYKAATRGHANHGWLMHTTPSVLQDIMILREFTLEC